MFLQVYVGDVQVVRAGPVGSQLRLLLNIGEDGVVGELEAPVHLLPSRPSAIAVTRRSLLNSWPGLEPIKM